MHSLDGGSPSSRSHDLTITSLIVKRFRVVVTTYPVITEQFITDRLVTSADSRLAESHHACRMLPNVAGCWFSQHPATSNTSNVNGFRHICRMLPNVFPDPPVCARACTRARAHTGSSAGVPLTFGNIRQKRRNGLIQRHLSVPNVVKTNIRQHSATFGTGLWGPMPPNADRKLSGEKFPIRTDWPDTSPANRE